MIWIKLLAFVCCVAPATQPAGPLKLTIDDNGEIAFTNTSDRDVTIMLPVDGSDVGWRAVSYEWEATNGDGTMLPRQRMPRCGTVNPLTASAFVTIQSGATYPFSSNNTFLSSWREHFSIPADGIIRVRLVYAFDPSRKSRDSGGHQPPDVAELLKRCEVTRVESNMLEIDLPAAVDSSRK